MTEAPRKNPFRRIPRWVVSLFCGVVIFVCGGVVGGSAAAFYIRARVLDAIHAPEVLEGRIVNRIDQLLGLDDAQRAAVAKIFLEHQQELHEVRDRFFPRIDAHLTELRDEITAVLDEDQKTRWLAAFERLRKTYIPEKYLDAAQ